MRLQLSFVCMLLLCCKYGGSDEDPSMGLAPDEGSGGQSLIDAAMASSGDSPSTPSTTPGSKPASACAPTVATCDPVRNTGCPPLMQCDIDTSASTPTGRCVFFQDPMGQACSSSFVSVGCAAQNTCVAGQCRKTCYCDSDCAQGQTCSDASGPGPAGAFKLCR